jgi:WD40 repeat protein
LATGHVDGTVHLWDLATLREQGTWQAFEGRGKPESFKAFAFAPDGHSLFTHVFGNTSGRLWDVSTGQGTTIPMPADCTTCAALSPDGRTVFGWKSPDHLSLWDLGTSQTMTGFPGLQGGVTCAAISPDGRVLATGGTDWTLKLWDLETGQVRGFLLGHGSEPRCLAFAPDGKSLASGSKDGVVKIWHVPTGQELLTLGGHRGEVASVAFSPDGRLLASGSQDPEGRGEIFLWLTESGTGPGQ